jgi:hypothetical protein
MHALTRCIFLLCLAFVAGCNQDSMIAKFTPHPEAEIARQAIDDWRTGHVDRLTVLLSPALAGDTEQLIAGGAQLSSAAPLSVKLVGLKRHVTNDVKRYDLMYEYAFGGRWMIAEVVIIEQGDRREIAGIHAQMHDRSLEQVNDFTLGQKSAEHYLVLFLCCLSPLVSLTAFVLCLRTPMRRRKIWWALFTLVGFVTWYFNWSTGELEFRPISLQLFGASAFASPYGPWTLGVSIPVGAIWFLLRRKKLSAPRGEPEQVSTPPE